SSSKVNSVIDEKYHVWNADAILSILSLLFLSDALSYRLEHVHCSWVNRAVLVDAEIDRHCAAILHTLTEHISVPLPAKIVSSPFLYVPFQLRCLSAVEVCRSLRIHLHRSRLGGLTIGSKHSYGRRHPSGKTLHKVLFF